MIGGMDGIAGGKENFFVTFTFCFVKSESRN